MSHPISIPVLEQNDFSVRPPGSKSETIRAMTAAALAGGRSHLYGALRSDDTEAMGGALRSFGVETGFADEPWFIDGGGGRLTEPPTAIDANESGLSARILLALAASTDGETVITGRGRLPERPMSGLVEALQSQGVEMHGSRLPIEVAGRGPLWGGLMRVDCSDSTQFATAIMLVAPIMHDPCVLEVVGMRGSSGYLDMTVEVMRRFGASVEETFTGYEIGNSGYQAADIVIEPDASAAVYPMAIAAVTGARVTVEGLGTRSRQPDLAVATRLEEMGCSVVREPDEIVITGPVTTLNGIDVDMSDAPDGALALAVACLFADGPSRISGLHSLRHKESDRLDAMVTEITRIGGSATVEDDALLIDPGADLHGAIVDPHGDHRIAMSMAIAGTVVPEVSVGDPGVVAKTWPGFWSFLKRISA